MVLIRPAEQALVTTNTAAMISGTGPRTINLIGTPAN